MQTISQRLKDLRKHLGLTQKVISESLNVKPSYYSDLENGHRTITGKFIEKLNHAFGVSADWMYTGKGSLNTLNSNNKMYPKSVPSVVPSLQSTITNSIENTMFPEDYFDSNNFYLKLNFEKKLLLDIIHNYKEDNELYSYLNELRMFEYLIDNLNYYYFNKIDLQFHSAELYLNNGIFNYEKYRDDYLSELRKLEGIKAALAKIAQSIEVFYKEIKTFDTEKVIEGYFNTSKS